MPSVCLESRPVFQHARLQPFLDQADDPTIADPVFDKSDEPSGSANRRTGAISASKIQLILRALIPNASASSASCWLRPVGTHS